MRVLFTHSYFLRFDPKQWQQMQPYAPLGTLYAASLLRLHGYDVALHDVMFAPGPESLQQPLEDFKPDLLVIYDDGFNYLTKMCLTNMRDAAFEMCQMAKAHDTKVIVCSSDATDNIGQYLDAGADYIIVGEGEQTLLELAGAIDSTVADYSHISGIVFRDRDKLVRTPARGVMHDLDALPFPAWDLVDISRYKEVWMNGSGYFSMNMSTTRGCPFHCNWCAKPIYGNRYNVRSPENVVAALVQLKEQYGFGHIWFADDIFGLKPGWVKRFAELVIQSKLNLRFKIQCRADLLLKDDQVALLAAAGCDTVWIGAESGSQKILDAMDKGITITQIEKATQLLKAHGIKVAYFLQFGYPGETMEDIAATLEMLQCNMPHDIGISVAYPLPGTKFYDNVRAQMQQKHNWTDSADLDLMFRSNFDTRFYRHLHKYVHAYFRRLKAMAHPHFSVRGLMSIPWYVLQERHYKYLIQKY